MKEVYSKILTGPPNKPANELISFQPNKLAEVAEVISPGMIHLFRFLNPEFPPNEDVVRDGVE